MSLFERLEPRSLALRDPALLEWFGGGARAASGLSVTPEKALGVPAFWSGVRLLCETLAALPLVLMKSVNGKTERARSHPLFRVLHEQPNRWQTSLEWREMCQAHILLRGVSYSAIVATRGGYPEQLIPLHPDRVTPRYEALRPGGEKIRYWRYDPPEGGTKIFLQDELFIVPGISIFDLLQAEDPIRISRDAIGLALAEQSHASHFFANGVAPSGVFQHPQRLKDEAYTRLKQDFAERRAGTANAGKAMILEEGMTWTQIGLTNREAQYIESRKFSVTDIARILRVPPHLIYDLERATFSNIEHQGIEFVKYTMLPWFVRWEQRIALQLLGPTERLTLFPKFIAEGLLRGDLKSRYDAYAVARQWGFASVNSILEKEDENPIGPEGDVYLVPTNMAPADQAGKPTAPVPPTPVPTPRVQPADKEDDDDDDERSALRQRLQVAHVRLFHDVAQRLMGKEAKSAQRAIAQARAQQSVTPLDKWLADTYDGDHETLVARSFAPVVHATADALRSAMAAPAMDTAFGEVHARTIARRYVSRQRAEAREVLTGTPEERAHALEVLMAACESRAFALAGSECEAIGSVIAEVSPLSPPSSSHAA